MVKQKYVVLAVSAVAVLGLGGGGYWYWHGQQQDDHVGPGAASIQEAGTVADNTAQQSPDQTTGSSTASSGTGLTANSSSSASLGQLAPPSSSSNSNSSSSGSGSSSGSNPLDPSTFSQYDKYQNSNQVMYADMQVGTGATVASGQQVSVYYKGWLTNGTLFDQSHTNSSGQQQPFSFAIGAGQVIKGWDAGVAGMKVGGTRLLIIPPSLGYGATGQGAIPGNAVLVFEVQVLSAK